MPPYMRRYSGGVDALSGGGGALHWHENSGDSQTFAAHEVSVDVSAVRAVDVADLDNDGDLDFVAAAFGSSQVSWWLNDCVEGDGALWATPTQPFDCATTEGPLQVLSDDGGSTFRVMELDLDTGHGRRGCFDVC